MYDCKQETADIEGDEEKSHELQQELKELEERAKELDDRRTSTISGIRYVTAFCNRYQFF